ncbi:MAG: LacI family DNA-binding transcriptional regulator [Lachnospiraceae bacterium]
MGITIKEIAELAGVHRSTVDKVLHRRDGVSDAVREKIQKIIDENNYQANPIGKALKMQNKQIKIKVVLLIVDAMSYIHRGMEKMLQNYAAFQIQIDYEVINYSDVAKQQNIIKDAVAQQYDGLIISPVNTPEIVDTINLGAEKGIPVVTVNSDIKGSKRFCFIGQDGYKAGRVAGRFMGEFLQGSGKAAILTSGDVQQTFPFGTREGGFREVLEGFYPAVQILPSVRTYENGAIMYRETKRLLTEHPDLCGIFITCGCVKDAGEAVKQYGNGKQKLICYEDYPEILELMNQGIVTMTLASGLEEQGGRAVQVLMDNLIYGKQTPKKHLYTDIGVLVKESL